MDDVALNCGALLKAFVICKSEGDAVAEGVQETLS
jgi:hypothetical protein